MRGHYVCFVAYEANPERYDAVVRLILEGCVVAGKNGSWWLSGAGVR